MSTLPDIDALSLQEQVAQTIVVRASGYLYDHQIQYPQWEPPNNVLRTWIEDWGIGGAILLGGSAPEIYLRSRQLQAWSRVPLLIGADVEEGVGQRFKGATWFPPPMALQSLSPSLSTEHAEAMGRVTAAEALAIGINWLFAPVVDVNNNPANPVINVRAFGESCEDVIASSTAFIRGARSHRILTTAKHFPGHGDTAVDSHLQTPVLEHDRDRFDRVELPPFAAAIAAGVDTVMSAHIFAPALDDRKIATLSPKILTDLLRQEMGFKGPIVTDALVMAGIANRYTPSDVAVQAVLAGADMLLMPIDPIETIVAICQAVEAGKIERDRIRSSVERIWQAKSRVCDWSLKDREKAPLYNLPEIASPDNLEIAAEITRKSLRIHLPAPLKLNVGQQSVNLVLVDNQLTCNEYLHDRAAAITVPATLGCTRLILDSSTLPHLELDNLPRAFVQIFSRGNPFRGSAGMQEEIESLVKKLLATDRLVAISIYGSPYNLERIVPLLPPETPWVFSYGQQPEAQQAVMQALGLK